MVTEPWTDDLRLWPGNVHAQIPQDGEGSGSHQRFLLCFVWMTPVLLFLTTLKVLFAGEHCLLCLNTSRCDPASVDY